MLLLHLIKWVTKCVVSGVLILTPVLRVLLQIIGHYISHCVRLQLCVATVWLHFNISKLQVAANNTRASNCVHAGHLLQRQTSEDAVEVEGSSATLDDPCKLSWLR